MYKETDKYISKLKKVLKREYQQMGLVGWDELNVIRVRKRTKSLFRRIDDMNRKAYRHICKYVEDLLLYEFLDDLDDLERKPSPSKVVEKSLGSYNPVTGYLYDKEWERKRLRMVEEIMTAATIQDRERYLKSLKRTFDLMFTQSSQYAQDVADTMETEVYKAASIPRVLGVTERDNRVCEECRERDGKIYPLDNVPPKPHYHCRCRIKPIR